MNRFWISWIQYTDDPRPVNFPPTPDVLGYWITGEDFEGNSTIVALVQADSEDGAKAIVGSDSNWPEAREWNEWRFCEKKEKDYIPGDRFPIPAWSPLFLTPETR